MRRISILVLILSAYFVTTAWAQQPATKPPIGRHLQHRMASQASRTPGLTVSRSFNAQANPDHAAKVWELGTYPGGTWFSTWHINDLGVIVGLGDVPGPDGVLSNHTLTVPLFGPRAGEWSDLNTLGGVQPQGWEEPFAEISDTGLVVSHSTTQDGQVHGVVWTKENGMVDLGTLADTHDPRYASYNTSYAIGTNKLGTLIVGGSGVDQNPDVGFLAPVVWTPSKEWMNGKFVTKWKIHKLDTAAFPDFSWAAWGVNDYGQIVGVGGDNNNPQTTVIGALWTPRADGKGWGKLIALPPSWAYPFSDPYAINERGEMAGQVGPVGWNTILPAYWKPLDKKRTTYSPPIVLPVPEGGFTNCWVVGINDLGDMVGQCWNDDDSLDLPVRWSTKDLTFAEIINFPALWGFAWGVNDNRIAAVTYTGGEKCSAGIPWTYTCGGAVQLH